MRASGGRSVANVMFSKKLKDDQEWLGRGKEGEKTLDKRKRHVQRALEE